MKTYLDAKKQKEGRSVFFFFYARMFEMNDTKTLSASELRKEKKIQILSFGNVRKRERISEVRAFKRKILNLENGCLEQSSFC